MAIGVITGPNNFLLALDSLKWVAVAESPPAFPQPPPSLRHL